MKKYSDIYVSQLNDALKNHASDYKITNQLIDDLLIPDNFLNRDMFQRWGFCWSDVSDYDFSELDVEHLRKLTFNSSTKWPEKDKMPKGFDPEKIIENGKDPMLGIRELHKAGITGKGTIVATIDSKPQNPEHIEIKDSSITYQSIEKPEKYYSHFHGDCILANLCGKTVGVAPECNAYHYYQDCGGEVKKLNKNTIKILENILKKLENGEQIKIISRSGPLFYDQDYIDRMGDKAYKEIDKDKNTIEMLTKKIEQYGCVIFDANKFGSCGFHCGHLFYDEDKYDIDNIRMASWLDKNNPAQEAWEKCRMHFICGGKCVPEYYSDNGYKFEQDDCYSWTIPQCAGLYALCLQVNPNITFDEYVDICKSTCDTNKNGFKIVNPGKVIESAKNYKPEEQLGEK